MEAEQLVPHQYFLDHKGFSGWTAATWKAACCPLRVGTEVRQGGGGGRYWLIKDGREAKGDQVGAVLSKSNGGLSLSHKQSTDKTRGLEIVLSSLGAHLPSVHFFFNSDGLVSPEDYIFCLRSNSYHT
jgi:hypothetical protein